MSIELLCSKAGVPNLWYAERFQVVRRKLETYFVTKKYASLSMGFTIVVRRNVFSSLWYVEICFVYSVVRG